MIRPYGERLIDQIVSENDLADRISSNNGHAIALSHDDLINLGNLADGCYSPLQGFMTEGECKSVVEKRKLPSGLDWTIPILLSVPPNAVAGFRGGESVSLADPRGSIVATIDIESVFEIDRTEYCEKIFGTNSKEHPGVQDCFKKTKLCVGGQVHVGENQIEKFRHYNTAADSRDRLQNSCQKQFTAFSTRNICHLGHEYLHNIALETGDILGINVITGAQVKGSFLPDVIFDTYEFLIADYYPKDKVFLNNLRLPPIYGGPKEAFLQATVLQNLGFTHFIVGRDHAGIGDFYPKYGSQQIFDELKGLTISILAISEPRFCRACDKITTERSCRHSGADIKKMNGRDVRLFLLEKRYKELESLLRPELRDHVVNLFEEKFEPGVSSMAMKKSRQIFYD